MLNIGSILLPIFLTIVLIKQLVQQEMVTGFLVLIGILFSIYIRRILLKGNVKNVILTIVVFFSLLITLICTVSEGIHDLGIIAYPIIIGFSGIILIRKKLIIASVLCLIGVIWLVLGDLFHIYNPLIPGRGNIGDFIVATTIILLGAYVAFSITTGMKHSLHKAQRGIQSTKKEAAKLSNELNEKSKIIDEIHKKVMNSMGYIQRLIHIQQRLNTETNEEYKSLTRKTIVIQIAHAQAMSRGNTEEVKLTSFLESLILKYLEIVNSNLDVDFQIEDHTITLDDAIYLGICLLELIHLIISNSQKKLTISVTKLDHTNIQLSGFSLHQPIETYSSWIILDLIIRQLKGTFTYENEPKSPMTISFKPGTEL